jgi:hypothetical protein
MQPRFLLYLLTFLLLNSCGDTKQELDALTLLDKSIEASGGEHFYNSVSTFVVNQFNYTVQRNGIEQHLIVTSEARNTRYRAEFNKGQRTYYVDDSLVSNTGLNTRFIDVNLEGFIYLLSVPHLLKTNASIYERKPDVVIQKKTYYTVKVTFTVVEGLPQNEFYLYIDPETFLVDFFAANYELAKGTNNFYRMVNRREVNGLSYFDYYSFTAESEDIALESLYKSFNALTIRETNYVQLKDIKVSRFDAFNNKPASPDAGDH